jgi:hypothetical protein
MMRKINTENVQNILLEIRALSRENTYVDRNLPPFAGSG